MSLRFIILVCQIQIQWFKNYLALLDSNRQWIFILDSTEKNNEIKE